MPQAEAPAPALEVDEALARRLIGAQFPEIALGKLRRYGEGFDNICWLVGGDLLFRFPRRGAARVGMEREMAVLGLLGQCLPLPIPQPRYLGRPDPDAGYPWPFFGGPWLPGVESSEASLDDAARIALAGPLGRFLQALHSPELAAEITAGHPLPTDPMGRADMGQRVGRTRAALGDVQRLGLWRPSPFVLDLLVSARQLPPPVTGGLVHGDLHFRHLLIDGDRLSGIIDWGDVCLGNPSMDLQLLWSFLPPAGRPEFVAAYGPIGQDNLLRARVLAFSLNALLATYGHTSGQPAIERAAVASLARAATD